MIALKPVLSAWLDEAEAARRDPDLTGMNGVLPPGEKKRKRTSIAAPEKRSLEAYFAVQPRPSGTNLYFNMACLHVACKMITTKFFFTGPGLWALMKPKYHYMLV